MKITWAWNTFAEYLGFGKRVMITVPLPQRYNLTNFSIYKCEQTNRLIITADTDRFIDIKTLKLNPIPNKC